MDQREFSCRPRNLRKRPLALLSTRNFEPHYNVACTLRAFARVQSRFPDVSLTVVGSGSQQTALKSLAAELGVRHVQFTGAVPLDRMPACYAAADLYVQTPSIDNMPLSVLEASASGLPIVSTNVGGVPTVVTHGVDGLLAPDNDADAVAGQIGHLIEDPDYAHQLAAAAHEKSARYDWQNVRDSWLAIYRALARRDLRAGTPLEIQGSA